MQPVSFNPAITGNVHSANPAFGQKDNGGTGNKSYRYPDEYVMRRRAMYDTYRRTVEYANLSDQQLFKIAKLDASKDDKYKFNTYAAALVGVPVADTFIRGTLSEAPKLSGKLKTMGAIGAGWIGALALAGIYNGVVDKVTAVSPTLRRTEDRHPVITSILRLAGFAALLVGATKGMGKLKTTVAKKFPGFVKDYHKMAKSLGDKINNSSFNKKFVSRIKGKAIELANKHPKLAGATLSTLLLAAPFVAAGTLFKAITDKNEKSAKIADTYRKLASARELNRRELDRIHSGVILDKFNESIAKRVDKADRSRVQVDDNPIDVEYTEI